MRFMYDLVKHDNAFNAKKILSIATKNAKSKLCVVLRLKYLRWSRRPSLIRPDFCCHYARISSSIHGEYMVKLMIL